MVWLPVSTIEVLQASARDRLYRRLVASHLAPEGMVFAEQDSAKHFASDVRRTVAFLQNSIQPLPSLPLQFFFRKRGIQNQIRHYIQRWTQVLLQRLEARMGHFRLRRCSQ